MPRKIAIIGTGGTFASLAESRTHEHYATASLSIDNILKHLPELKDVAAIYSEQLVQVFSQNMTYEIWHQIAQRVQTLVDDPEFVGVVITHGTDSLEETAYFLNLVIKSNKPVVLTGAMRPANALSADGLRNLYDAVVLASHPDSQGRGVLVTLNDTIHFARDVTKTNVFTADSFKSTELGLLGYIQGKTPYFYRTVTRKHTSSSEFTLPAPGTLPPVHIIFAYIGSTRLMVDTLVQNGCQGIISAGMGQGEQTEEVLAALIEAQKKGVVIVRCSRVENGIVTRNPDIDDKYHFVVGNNLSPQKSRILLSLALTKTKDVKEIQRIFDAY